MRQNFMNLTVYIVYTINSSCAIYSNGRQTCKFGIFKIIQIGKDVKSYKLTAGPYLWYIYNSCKFLLSQCLLSWIRFWVSISVFGANFSLRCGPAGHLFRLTMKIKWMQVVAEWMGWPEHFPPKSFWIQDMTRHFRCTWLSLLWCHVDFRSPLQLFEFWPLIPYPGRGKCNKFQFKKTLLYTFLSFVNWT